MKRKVIEYKASSYGEAASWMVSAKLEYTDANVKLFPLVRIPGTNVFICSCEIDILEVEKEQFQEI
jgi:hypothetical protein